MKNGQKLKEVKRVNPREKNKIPKKHKTSLSMLICVEMIILKKHAYCSYSYNEAIASENGKKGDIKSGERGT